MLDRYQPHLLILPEDDATRQLAAEFVAQPRVNGRQLQLLPPAQGWLRTIETFQRDHEAAMHRFPERLVLILIDFDNDTTRVEYVRDRIALGVRERVFVLGALIAPEALRRATEMTAMHMGRCLAEECRSASRVVWNHPHLAHNAQELNRLCSRLHFLFA